MTWREPSGEVGGGFHEEEPLIIEDDSDDESDDEAEAGVASSDLLAKTRASVAWPL